VKDDPPPCLIPVGDPQRFQFKPGSKCVLPENARLYKLRSDLLVTDKLLVSGKLLAVGDVVACGGMPALIVSFRIHPGNSRVDVVTSTGQDHDLGCILLAQLNPTQLNGAELASTKSLLLVGSVEKLQKKEKELKQRRAKTKALPRSPPTTPPPSQRDRHGPERYSPSMGQLKLSSPMSKKKLQVLTLAISSLSFSFTYAL
jgi:hypothetical protein